MENRDNRMALIVLGMHRSGTSAMAGLLGEMGCDLPKDLMAPKEMNARGFFESNKITYLNEDILTSAGMTWFDLNHFPDAWYASAKVQEFRKRARAALLDEFGESGLFVMKDPRQCRLIPFWEDVLAKQEVQPIYVCIHRNPVDVAASLLRWAGYEPLYGEYLWLRHVLDAEIATRGRKRVFVSYDQVLSDWRDLVSRISSDLNLVFPRSVQTAARGVQRFLSPDLKHFSSEDLANRKLKETSDWLAITWKVLVRWSRTGEDFSDHAMLDHVRDAMDAASDTMVTAFDRLLSHHHEIERLRQEQAETSALVASLSAAVETQNQHNKQLEGSLRDKLEHQSAQLDEAKAAVAGCEGKLLRQSAQLDEANTALANSETTIGEIRNTLHLTWLETIALQNDLNSRTDELRYARSRPLQNLSKYLEFRALRILSSHGTPLPPKMKARFIRSANKRHPDRYPLQIKGDVTTTTDDAVALQFAQGQEICRPDLPSVIIVTHEASRTGAPILALNMAQTLAARYNVVTVCLRGGDLADEFRKVSTELYIAEHAGGRELHFDRMLDAITAHKIPVFAVVNSIESRHILGPLRKYQIPSVALFHEFASYTLPRSAFTDAFHLADEVVFSSELTIQNALEQTSFVRSPRFHVLAQGRCELPRDTGKDVLSQIERDRLTARLRPNGETAGEFLVIGAGYVQMRKGVDLFIDVARRVLATEEGRNCRFAWIGAGYDPEHDAAYSVYLRDQIERAGLSDQMMMLGETSQIEQVYALSNLLLLTSRLDPLPNVAIDALSEGVPVVCFDRTTGIADLLTNAGLRDACVADYLDTQQAAEKVLWLVRSPEAYRWVCNTSKAFAARTLDFDAYAAQIEELGLRVRKFWSLRVDDVSTVAAADEFDPAFMMPSQSTASTRREAADYYLSDSWRDALPRRPEPGFNPLIYARHLEAEGVFDVDAYATFLRRGRPPGPWLRSVIRESAGVSMPDGETPLKTALHIHAYYPDVVATIAERLAHNEIQPDLFINAVDRRSLDAAVEMLKGYSGRIAEARVLVNRGRDIGSLLTEFGGRLVRDYDLIGHVHTKKSELLSDRNFVERWVGFLYENMIGGRHGGAMMDRIVAAFTKNERLGIVFPSDPNILAWSNNEGSARKLATRLGLERLPEFIDFPIGSMFWLRAAALEPFLALQLGWNDYPPEPVRYDGTVLHAIERLFGLVAESRGLELACTNVKGVTR